MIKTSDINNEVIVSVTPMKVIEDSRTYKIAYSFSRMGYKSIVVEGRESGEKKKTFPFKLLAVAKSEVIVSEPESREIVNEVKTEVEFSIKDEQSKQCINQEVNEDGQKNNVEKKALSRIQNKSRKTNNITQANEKTNRLVFKKIISNLRNIIRKLPLPVKSRLYRTLIFFLKFFHLMKNVFLLPRFIKNKLNAYTKKNISNTQNIIKKSPLPVRHCLYLTAMFFLKLFHLMKNVFFLPRFIKNKLIRNITYTKDRLAKETGGITFSILYFFYLIKRTILYIYWIGIVPKIQTKNWYVKLIFITNHMRIYGTEVFRVLPRASVYYLHAPYQFPSVYFASLRYGARFIYDAHDFYPIVDPDPFYNFLEKMCIKKSAAVVTVSKGVADMYKKSYLCEPYIMRNCHDQRLDSAVDVSVKKKLGLSDKDYLLISIGHGGKPGQAITEAVKSLSLLPNNIHLALLGNYHEGILSIVESLDLSDRVHIIKPVLPNDIVSFIRDADVSLILYYSKDDNYKFALPNKFFQSIAAELPILYSPELSEINHFASQYNLGIEIEPRLPESIAQGIKKICDEQILSECRYSINNLKEKLNWECEEQKLFQVLGETVYS